MPRVPTRVEQQRERVEAAQAILGNALIYLHLIQDRTQAALLINGNQALLAPALEDGQRASALIRQAQTIISDWSNQP